MDEEDEHPWPVSPITTHEEGTMPPLPFEELLMPPLPSSPQHPFLGVLQVDGAGGVGVQATDNAARHSMQASRYTTLSDDSDDSKEDVGEEAERTPSERAPSGEPPCKKPRQWGEDSPDVGTRRSRNSDSVSSVSSSNSSANTSQYVASNDLDYNPNYFNADAFDIDVSTMCVNENMTGDERAAESGNSESEHDSQDELLDEDSDSVSSSQKEECVQEDIQNEDDKKIGDEDSDSVGSSQQELEEETNQDEEDIEVDDINEPVNVFNQDINEEMFQPDDDIQDAIDGTNADDYHEDGYSDYDSDDIDALLEEGLPEDVRIPWRKRKIDDIGSQDSQKVVDGESAQKEALPDGLIRITERTHLKVGKQMPVDLLPPGWISITHDCGMPLYLHRPSRVVTWARPYALGSGSARRHKVPVNSIPCLHYKKQKEKEAAENNPSSNVNQTQSNNQECQPEDNLNAARGEQNDSESIKNGRVGGCQPGGKATQLQAVEPNLNSNSTADKEKDVNSGDSNRVPNGKTNCVNDNGAAPNDFVSKHIYICKDESIGGATLREYLDKLFEFETHAVRKYRSWTDRRKHMRRAKKQTYQERPEFPTGPTLITCQIPETLGRSSGKKEFVINALNKSPVCILHEYIQRVVKTVPTYSYTESGNANSLFEACVLIGGVKYGRGQAKSKKFAKYEAARATLKLLIPDVHNIIKKSDKKEEPNNLEYFDHVAIDDLRVYELCERSGLLTPWQLLQEYQQRNYGMSNVQVRLDVQISKNQKSNYTMTYGPHVVTGMCKNKKLSKQIGAQQILVKLHPHLSNWGAIIKMYGRQGMSTMNLEKKELKQSIVELQGKAKNKPNDRILNKLKSEMKRLYMEKQQTATPEISSLESITTAS